MMRERKHICFCVGTGRCGTTFITRVAGLEPRVAASHERLRRAATYHMFCKWHGIAVDHEGFLADREAAIERDLESHDVSFESSALVSHSIAELYQRFAAKFLLLVRRPDHTVASFAVRGWYREPLRWNDPSLPPVLPDAMEPRHFFGRNLPRSVEELERFQALSQVGKMAWFWQARYGDIIRQLRALPATQRHVVRLEELDFDRYRRVAQFIGFSPTISRERYDDLVGQKLNAGPNLPKAPETWSAREIREFEREVATVAETLGYEHRIDELLAGQDPLVARGDIDLGED